MYLQFWPDLQKLNDRETHREEFTGQLVSQLRLYGKIYTLCDFTSRQRVPLTLCGTRWSRSFFHFLPLNLHGPNSQKQSFDTCIAPGGNTFAQSTRQLILSMSGALGERMKQRFDLIGYEKVSHLCPVGREEGYRGKGWHLQGQMHKAMIYLCDSHLSQGATLLLHP